MKTFKDFIYEKINEETLSYGGLKFNVNSTIDGYVKVKEDDPSIYKMFMSGAGCVDETNTCTKVWDGTLSKGGVTPEWKL